MKFKDIKILNFYIFSFKVLMFVSFLQIVVFPLIRPTAKYIFLRPISHEKLNIWLLKICEKKIVKDSRENSLIKYVCSKNKLK